MANMHKTVHADKYRKLVPVFANRVNTDGTYCDSEAIPASEIAEVWGCTTRNARYQLSRMEVENMVRIVSIAVDGRHAMGFTPVGDLHMDAIRHFNRAYVSRRGES